MSLKTNVCIIRRHSSLQLAEHPDGICSDIIQKLLEKIKQLSQQKSVEGGEADDNEINLVRCQIVVGGFYLGI